MTRLREAVRAGKGQWCSSATTKECVIIMAA